MPLDQNNLFIHKVIKECAPELQAKIGAFKEKLSKETSPEHKRNLEIAKRLEETFLFEGYQEYFTNIIPMSNYSSKDTENLDTSINPFPTVLCHNDIHQNNILMSVKDN
jgi:thiamine kinase-like enzyme